MNYLHPFPTDEYFSRFMEPHFDRGMKAGISIDELHAMASSAIETSNLRTTFPGQLFRDMVDQRIAEVNEP